MSQFDIIGPHRRPTPIHDLFCQQLRAAGVEWTPAADVRAFLQMVIVTPGRDPVVIPSPPCWGQVAGVAGVIGLAADHIDEVFREAHRALGLEEPAHTVYGRVERDDGR